MTCQTALGIFSFSLVYSKKLSLSRNIYLSSLLLSQSSQGQSFDVIQSKIKEELHVYASNNLCFEISNLVSNWDKVNKTKMKHTQKIWLDPYRETWKTSLSRPCSWSDDLTNYPWVFFVTLCTYAFDFNFIYAQFFIFNKRTYQLNYI